MTGQAGAHERLAAERASTLERLNGLERELREIIEAADTAGTDDDNRAAVRAVAADEMPLVRLAVYGPKNAVDKIFKGFPLHP